MSSIDFANMEMFPMHTISNDEKLHDYFKERIQYFFFNFTRKTTQHSIQILQTQFKDCLSILRKNLIVNNYPKDLTYYLELLYCLIAQTRDVVYGKGERELSYMLIYTFYEFYPSLTFFLIQRLVYPPFETNNHKLCYGSWRDIPALCSFIKRFSNNSEHTLIDYCIELINNQLINDHNIWIHSSRKSKTIISNVAKWIPRENKQHDWLFHRLAIHWAKIRHPNILRTASNEEQHAKATSKCKRLYRKQVSFLNKQLQTFEYLMCSNQMDYLQDKSLPVYHFCKHFSYYHQSIYHRDLLKNHASLPDDLILPYYANHFPLSFFIQKARFYSELSSEDKKKHHQEILNLNSLWMKNIQKIPFGHFDHIIPFIDVSFTMQNNHSDLFYSAIALSIIIAQRSLSSRRIIAIDTFPTWINFDHKNDLVSIVKEFFHTIYSMQNTTPNFKNAIEMFHNGLLVSEANHQFIENMTVVFFSNFQSFVDYNNEIVNETEQNMYTQLSSFFKPHCIPYFVFWNLSETNNISIPSHRNNDKVCFLSGMSMNLLGHLPHMKTINRSYSFMFISKILFSIRYNSLSNYLYQAIQSNK